MPQSLACPKCHAPIPYESDAGATVACPFCGNTVTTPEDWRAPASAMPLANLGDLGGMLQQAMQLKAIAELARAGKKIEAIKQYRALTGLGLKEAKDAVEQMAAGQVAVQVNSFSTTSANSSGDPARWTEIKTLVESGNKIEAIKLFRELTGAGLKEAKDAVEQMEAHQNFDVSAVRIGITGAGDIQSAQMLAVQTLLGMGKKIEAIKVYRQLTGVGLKEAKDAVEAMERGGSAPAALTHSDSGFNIPPSSTLKFPQSPSVVEPEGNTGRGCLVWGGALFALLLVAAVGAAVFIFITFMR